MPELGVKLHPVKKLQLWKDIKQAVFDKMDKDIITPERADQILSKIKAEIVKINTPEEAKQFYLEQSKSYPELSTLVQKLENEETEAFDKLLSLLLDNIMQKGQIELASELMEEIRNTKDLKSLTEDLQKRYPVEFTSCLNNFSQQFS